MTVKFKLPYGKEKELMPVLEHYSVHDFMGKEMPGLAIALDEVNVAH